MDVLLFATKSFFSMLLCAKNQCNFIILLAFVSPYFVPWAVTIPPSSWKYHYPEQLNILSLDCIGWFFSLPSISEMFINSSDLAKISKLDLLWLSLWAETFQKMYESSLQRIPRNAASVPVTWTNQKFTPVVEHWLQFCWNVGFMDSYFLNVTI